MKREKTVYALGFFDGVHLGHQALLKACCDLSRQIGAVAAALTFSGHPHALVSGKAPALINSVGDRERLLRQCGMERVIVLPFDEKLMRTPWQDFFARLLYEYNAAGLVCGDDFRFGQRGAGNAQLLKSACETAGIPCVIVPEQTMDGLRVSSTHIRKCLQEGKMGAAVRFLGHPHVLTGEVVSGQKLGRTLGTPTANLTLPDGVVCPAYGVYACRAVVDGKAHLAVTNIGTRPTVKGDHVTVEPWLLDFEGDLYGKQMRMEFYAFLRPERKFASLDALKAEIQKNAAQTREIFEKM